MIRGSFGPRGRALRVPAAGCAGGGGAGPTPEAGSSGAGSPAVAGIAGAAIVPAESTPVVAGSSGAGVAAAAGVAGGGLRASLPRA